MDTILIGGVLLVVVIILVALYFSYYNRIRTYENQIAEAWAQIDVQLKKRFDLVPNLVETVKGYAKHEREIFEKVTEARSRIVTGSPEERMQASNQLTAALRTVFAVAENYPNLKANDSFIQLQTRISGIENELADRREFYNDSVNTFNIKIQSFPDRIVAGMLGYRQPEELFKATEGEKKDVKIDFSDVK